MSATSASCSSGPSLAVILSISPPSASSRSASPSSESTRSISPSSASSWSASPPGCSARCMAPPSAGRRSSKPPGWVSRSTTPPGRSIRSIGPLGAMARPSGISSSNSLASRLARAIVSSIPSMLAIEVDPLAPPASPNACLAMSTAAPAMFKPVSAAASPARAGQVAIPTRVWPRFILRVYSRRAVD
ncbi:Uncharacterised protein [Mycobacterium tuberculosis]|nr:Uncharacterised protein [Mycobacterium tuberculosis]